MPTVTRLRKRSMGGDTGDAAAPAAALTIGRIVMFVTLNSTVYLPAIISRPQHAGRQEDWSLGEYSPLREALLLLTEEDASSPCGCCRPTLVFAGGRAQVHDDGDIGVRNWDGDQTFRVSPGDL